MVDKENTFSFLISSSKHKRETKKGTGKLTKLTKSQKINRNEKLQYFYKTGNCANHASQMIIKCNFSSTSTKEPWHTLGPETSVKHKQLRLKIHDTEILNVLEKSIAVIYRWKTACKSAKPSCDYRTTSCKNNGYYFTGEPEWEEALRLVTDTRRNKPKQIELILTSNRQTKDTSWTRNSAATWSECWPGLGSLVSSPGSS